MAQTRASFPLFFISLLLFSIVNPPAHATFVPPYNYLNATGQLCCSSNGNCPGSGLAGVLVTLTCSDSFYSGTVGQNFTDTNGFFTITTPPPVGLGAGIGLPPSCVVIAQLPVSSNVCSLLSTNTGSLIGFLSTVTTTVVQALGTVLNLRLLIVLKI